MPGAYGQHRLVRVVCQESDGHLGAPAFLRTVLHIDVMDVSGEQQLDIEHNIYKRRLDKSGEVIDEHKQDREFAAPLPPYPTLPRAPCVLPGALWQLAGHVSLAGASAAMVAVVQVRTADGMATAAQQARSEGIPA